MEFPKNVDDSFARIWRTNVDTNLGGPGGLKASRINVGREAEYGEHAMQEAVVLRLDTLPPRGSTRMAKPKLAQTRINSPFWHWAKLLHLTRSAYSIFENKAKTLSRSADFAMSLAVNPALSWMLVFALCASNTITTYS